MTSTKIVCEGHALWTPLEPVGPPAVQPSNGARKPEGGKVPSNSTHANHTGEIKTMSVTLLFLSIVTSLPYRHAFQSCELTAYFLPLLDPTQWVSDPLSRIVSSHICLWKLLCGRLHKASDQFSLLAIFVIWIFSSRTAFWLHISAAVKCRICPTPCLRSMATVALASRRCSSL